MAKVKFNEADLKRKITKEAEEKFLQRVNNLLDDLKKVTPKDTGLASESWVVKKINGLEAVISNEQDYVIVLNSGSSRQAPRNFIEIAMLNNGFKLKTSIKNKI
jgi:hypothetical protein